IEDNTSADTLFQLTLLLSVSKQFGFKYFFVNAFAIYHNKRSKTSFTFIMHNASEKFFTRSTFTSYQERRIDIFQSNDVFPDLRGLRGSSNPGIFTVVWSRKSTDQ